MLAIRRLVLAVILMTLVLPAGAGSAEQPAGEQLVLVRGDLAEVSLLVETLGLPVYHRAGGRLLVGAGEDTLARLGKAATVVDHAPWPAGSNYYWVTVSGSRDAALPARDGIQVLHRDGGTALVKATSAAAEQLSMVGHELAVVTRAHKALAPKVDSTLLDGTRAFGGEIDNMVAAVNQLSYTSTLQALVNFVTRYTYSTEVDDAADYIYNRFTGFGLATERHEFAISSYTKENIIATLPGLVYPDEVVFICAHFDSTSNDPYNLAPGADDDGSGTAAVIEAARILSGYTFERTIKFGAWSGEEQGLYGSAAYVADVAAAGMNIVGCYNFDMIGYSGSDPAPPDFVIYTDTASTAIADTLHDAALYYVSTDIEPIVIHEALSASDHASFWNHGYQAIVASEDEAWGDDFSPVYHTTNDDMSYIDAAYATACSKAALAAVAETAVYFSPTGLRVTPMEDYVAEGPNGGPFTPQQMVYTLINQENYPLDYTVSESAAWLDLSTGGGTIPALGSTTVTVSVNTTANSMADGNYTAAVDFVNTTNHDGDTTRTADLTVGAPTLQHQWTLDSDPGWTTQNQWAWGQPSGGGGAYGNPDPTGGHSGSNVYGYNLSGDYQNSLDEAHVTSNAIDCSNLIGTTLKFWRWLNVEQPVYDHAYVRVSNDGVNWTQVWTNTAEVTDASWSQVEYDISTVADGQSTVYLRWTMGDTDSAWTYSGWNIDDVEVWAILESPQYTDTVAVALACTPGQVTLPATVQMAVSLTNLTTENRQAAGSIGVVLGNGSSYSNWRSGFTNLSPLEVFNTAWNQSLPGVAGLVGDNVFTMLGEDITPPPYNQPPFAPSGDTDSDVCTVTATVP